MVTGLDEVAGAGLPEDVVAVRVSGGMGVHARP
jgi:hypothetical protein